MKQERVTLTILCNVSATDHLMSYQPISKNDLYNTSELCVNLCHLNEINFYLSRLINDYEGVISSPHTTTPILFTSIKQRQAQGLSLYSFFYLMVGKRGFEPRTPASRTLCSTRLSHFPKPRSMYRKESLSKSSTFALYRLLFS